MMKTVLAALALVVTFGTMQAHASATEVEGAPRTAAATKGPMDVINTIGEVNKEVKIGTFVEDYMKKATAVEDYVDSQVGKDASLFKKFWFRVTHPIKVIWPMVKFVGERAVLPIVKAVIAF